MQQALREGLERAWLEKDCLRARFRFPSTLPLFAGHFPDRPMVPGVLELAAVRYALGQVREDALQLEEVVDARFSQPVVPETLLEIEASLVHKDDGRLRVRARLRCEGVEVGRTTLVMRPEDPS